MTSKGVKLFNFQKLSIKAMEEMEKARSYKTNIQRWRYPLSQYSRLA